MIVKLQRPLASNRANPPWLIYDRDHSFQVLVAAERLPAHVLKAMGDRNVGYFEVAARNGQVTQWGRMMTDQHWR